MEVHFSEQTITQNPKVRARRRRFFVTPRSIYEDFQSENEWHRRNFHGYNSNVFAISTFWKLWVHHNFNGSAISTFVIFWNYDNFNVTQFQRARAARTGKNTSQFQQVCNFYVLNFCKIRQFQRCNNFYVLENIVLLQFQRASNFYVWDLLRVQQFRCYAISILDLEISLPKMLTISTRRSILTHFLRDEC